MSQANNNKRDGVVPAGPGGDHRRGGGLIRGGGERTDAPTKSALRPGVQPGQGHTTAEQASDVFIFTGSQNSVGDAGTGIYKNKVDLIDKEKVESAIDMKPVGHAGIARDIEIYDIDDDSFADDAVDVSTLDSTSIDDPNVNFADVTVLNLDKSIIDEINKAIVIRQNEKKKFIENDNDSDFVKVNTGKENDDDLMDTSTAREVANEKEKGQAGTSERVKGKRSFPQSTNDRRFGKNQRKAAQKEKYKIPDDPFLAEVDREYMKRKSYADCVREKDNIILEIRNEDLNIALESKDFKLINSHLLFKYLECKQQNLAELEVSEDEESDDEENDQKFFYGVIGGISNGAVWLACDNSTTADFVKYQVPLISSSECRYKVYTSEARPFRYMKAKIPVEFWADRKTVQGAFIASNRCLNKRVLNAAGKREAPHFKICFGCESFEDDLDEFDKNYYWIQFSVDERLMNKLAELKGRLRLGATGIQLLGGGMVTKAKEVIADKLKGAIDSVEDASG